MTGSNEDQRIVRMPGRRRVRLTPAPGTGSEPDVETQSDEPGDAASGPNDERLRREVPPHY